MKAIYLTEKALRRILLALRAMKYNTEAERAYMQWVITQIKKQTERK